nr:hypothetical protein [Candidatus Enterovibrio escacola]
MVNLLAGAPRVLFKPKKPICRSEVSLIEFKNQYVFTSAIILQQNI